MISLTEQRKLVQIVVFGFPMPEVMDVTILSLEEVVNGVVNIGVMYAEEILELVDVRSKDPHSVDHEMGKTVVVFLVKVVPLGHLVKIVIKMDVVLIVLDDRFF